jgi:hypothetical protein
MRIKTIISSASTSVLLIAGLGSGVAGAAAPSTVYVSTKHCSDAGPGTNQTPYCTVQKGLDSVAAGGTVNVDKGTYPEQITMSKNNVTLKGSGNNTVIQAPASLTGGNIVDINAKGVTIRDLTVNGPFNSNNCGSTEYGVFFEDKSSGTVTNSQVTNIGETDQTNFGGCQQGVAIRVGSEALSIKATATITNDKVSGYQKGGIVVDGPGTSATVNNNTVDGGGPTSVIARNGIQISRGASADVNNNTVRNNQYVGNSATAAGILTYSDANIVKNLTAVHNVVNNNDVGFDIDARSSSFTQNTANSNTLNGFYAEPTSKNDTFTQNDVHNTGGNANFTAYDMEDDSTGNGTLGTANTWHQNGCKTSSPAELCRQ